MTTIAGLGPGASTETKPTQPVAALIRLREQLDRPKILVHSMITKKAFIRMAKSATFQKWARIEACRVTGKLAQIEEWVDHELSVNTRIERKEKGKWVPWEEEDGVLGISA